MVMNRAFISTAGIREFMGGQAAGRNILFSFQPKDDSGDYLVTGIKVSFRVACLILRMLIRVLLDNRLFFSRAALFIISVLPFISSLPTPDDVCVVDQDPGDRVGGLEISAHLYRTSTMSFTHPMIFFGKKSGLRADLHHVVRTNIHNR
jgi:hypothetical protein